MPRWLGPRHVAERGIADRQHPRDVSSEVGRRCRRIRGDEQTDHLTAAGGVGKASGERRAAEKRGDAFELPLVNVVDRVAESAAAVSIDDARIIVAGGRGVGSQEGFELVEQLAEALGGAVGATRAAVDAGWIPYGQQIGQTGKIVKPQLYLALGISGAIQHKVGMQGSNAIVAINKDPNAPIFEFSDLGVVGDLHEIVPKLVELVRARRS